MNTDILQALQPELLSVVIALAAGAAAYLYQWAVQRLPANAQKVVNTLAQAVVQAIEQKYTGNNPGGALKKQEAMQAVSVMVRELHLPFNTNNVSTAIESAVYTMNLYQKFRRSAPTTAPASAPTASLADQPTRIVPAVSVSAPTTTTTGRTGTLG